MEIDPVPTPRLAQLKITEISVAARAELGFDYVLKLSPARSTVSLEVKAGRVTLRAPLKVDRKALAAWVAQRKLWVLEKQREQWQRKRQAVPPNYESGSLLKWLGRDYPLHIATGEKTSVTLRDGCLRVTLGAKAGSGKEAVRKAVASWYQARARDLLERKTHHYSATLGVDVLDMTLRQTKTKWGHCTREGKIQYNWLIVLAPEAVVDYLVVHEVCHRLQLNHSDRFWALVESLCPNYRPLRRWLKEQGHTLTL